MGVETILRASRLTATPAMTDDNQLSFNLPSVSRKKVTAAFDGGRLSSDSGVMLLALADRRRAVADTLAALIADHRDPSHITHTVADVLRARMLAIGCGYPDGNDFDRLRFDPAFKLACGRLPDSGGDLCSQPTISRKENEPTQRESKRTSGRYLVPEIPEATPVYCPGHRRHGQCCARPPAIGAMEAQYNQHCFLPIHVMMRRRVLQLRGFCVPARRRRAWRFASCSAACPVASAGIGPIPKSPSAERHYGREEAMTWCENYGIDYIFGLSGNVVLDRLVDAASTISGCAVPEPG